MTKERPKTDAGGDATQTRGAPLLWSVVALMFCWLAVGGATTVAGGPPQVFAEDQVLADAFVAEGHFGVGLAGSAVNLTIGMSDGAQVFHQLWNWDPILGNWQTDGSADGPGTAWLPWAPLAIDSTTAAWYLDYVTQGDPWPKIQIVGLPGASGGPRSGSVVWLDQPSLPSATTLAIDGFRLVVGDHAFNAVHAHEYDPVTEAWEFTGAVENPSSPPSGFGRALALEGDLLVVGSHHPLVGDTGSVAVYKADPDDVLCPDYYCLWDELTVGQADNFFGQAVALSGDWLAVGAPYQDSTLPPFQDRGTVFLYQRDATGHFVLRTAVSGPGPTFHFGYSVALSGSTLLVGAPGEDFDIPPFNFEDIGAAYLFRRSGAQLVATAKLQSTSLQAGMRLGETVALSRYAALAGAPNMDVLGHDSGAVLSWVGPIALFTDGFESGDISAWSSAVP